MSELTKREQIAAMMARPVTEMLTTLYVTEGHAFDGEDAARHTVEHTDALIAKLAESEPEPDPRDARIAELEAALELHEQALFDWVMDGINECGDEFWGAVDDPDADWASALDSSMAAAMRNPAIRARVDAWLNAVGDEWVAFMAKHQTLKGATDES